MQIIVSSQTICPLSTSIGFTNDNYYNEDDNTVITIASSPCDQMMKTPGILCDTVQVVNKHDKSVNVFLWGEVTELNNCNQSIYNFIESGKEI